MIRMIEGSVLLWFGLCVKCDNTVIRVVTSSLNLMNLLFYMNRSILLRLMVG